MVRFWLIGLFLLPAYTGEHDSKRVKPIEVTTSVKACAGTNTFVSEKGVCYVYDISDKRGYIEVSIAAGVVASAGNIVLGGSGKVVFETTARFALGTNREDAVASARSALDEKLKTKAVQDEIRRFGLQFDAVQQSKAVVQCPVDDPIAKRLREIFSKK